MLCSTVSVCSCIKPIWHAVLPHYAARSVPPGMPCCHTMSIESSLFNYIINRKAGFTFAVLMCHTWYYIKDQNYVHVIVNFYTAIHTYIQSVPDLLLSCCPCIGLPLLRQYIKLIVRKLYLFILCACCVFLTFEFFPVCSFNWI